MITKSENVLDFLSDDEAAEEKPVEPKVHYVTMRAAPQYTGIVGTIRRKSSTNIIKLEIRRYLSKDELGVIGDGITQYVSEVTDFVYGMPLNITTVTNIRYSKPSFAYPGWGHYRRTMRNIVYNFYIDAAVFCGDDSILETIQDYFDDKSALLTIDYQTLLFIQQTKKRIQLMTTPASRYIATSGLTDLVSSIPNLLFYDKRRNIILPSDMNAASTSIFNWQNLNSATINVGITEHKNRFDIYIDNPRSYRITPVQELGDWFLCYEKTGIAAKYKDVYEQVVSIIQQKDKERGWGLWEHQINDLAMLIIKKRILLSANVGTGKTRVFAAAMDILSKGNSGTFVEAGLLPEFQKEYQNFKGNQKIDIAKETIRPSIDKAMLITYSSLNSEISDPFMKKDIREREEKKRTRIAANIKKQIDDHANFYTNKYIEKLQEELEELNEYDQNPTMAELYSRWKFNFIGFDESHNLKKEGSGRFKSCMKIQSSYRLAASGTITTGNPKDVFSQLKIVLAVGSQPLRILTKATEGLTYISYQNALTRFITRRKVGSKVIDDILDHTWWKRAIDPYVVYTDKNSPKVSKSQVFKKYTMHTIPVSPDRKHFLMFASNIKKFGEDLKEFKFDNDIDVLARMRILADVSAAPQLPHISELFPDPYSGLTEKQKQVISIIDNEVEKGNQLILFTERNETAKLLADLITKNSKEGAVVSNTAGMNIKQRFEAIEKFRKGGATVLCGSYRGLGRGYNLPQASAMILYELYWTIDVEEQAIGRMMRPQQQQNPRVYMIYNRGMIDDYQVNQILKTRRRNSEIILKGSTQIKEQPILTYREVAKSMLDYLEQLPVREANVPVVGKEVVNEFVL